MNIMPSNVSKIIQNKEADCNIFATVVDITESKNDFFTCQVFFPPGGMPSLIIHCVQKRFKPRQCKLKIGWMVIGYCTDISSALLYSDIQLKVLKTDFTHNQEMTKDVLLDFEYNSYITKTPLCLGMPMLTKLDSSNYSLVIGHYFFNAQEENKTRVRTFSYCLKDDHCVNLPDFTFYTLSISNYSVNNSSDLISFYYPHLKKPYIKVNDNTTTPKFISLYSTQKTKYGPIFFKQKTKLIKIKSIKCKKVSCPFCRINH